MVISYNQLVNEVVAKGFLVGVDPENINGSSIDIRLGSTIMVEDYPALSCQSCGRERTEKYEKFLNGFYQFPNIQCPCGYIGHFTDFVTPVDFSKKDPLAMKEISIEEKPYVLQPGQVCLAESVELFNLPAHITAEYRLKSSMARVFLEHLHAGWCDPTWNGAVLTMEYANMTQYHPMVLRAGEKCGQVMFYAHDPVPPEVSYAQRGQYNNTTKVSASRGVK